MKKIRLGRTGLMVTKTAFGALPIQRLAMGEAERLLKRAYDEGINFFDTANMYSDSEEKLGNALSSVRQNVILATKSGGKDKKTVLSHIETSLKRLKTDYIDLIQLHNPGELPDTRDPDSTYGALKEAQKRGYVRFIGITNHSASRAEEAVRSGSYDTLQYPFSFLNAERDEAIARLARDADMGFIAMKALAGGLIASAAAAFAYIRQFPFVVPLWGIQRERELEQFLELEQHPPKYEDVAAVIRKDRQELTGNFCHGCGYCLPCPAGIDIPVMSRMSLLLRRAPVEPLLNEINREKMLRIRDCIECRQCAARCPYELDPPPLLRENLRDYISFYRDYTKEELE